MVPQRDQTLEDELRKQQNNEALRRQFADKSNQVGPWIERQMDAVAAIGMGMQVSNISFESSDYILEIGLTCLAPDTLKEIAYQKRNLHK